jgi:hypothetical protein
MKHTQSAACLSPQLLRFVRDHAPTVDEFLARFGGPGGTVFQLLRKQGILVEEGGRLCLSPERVSADGKRFTIGPQVFHIDTDQVDFVRWRR